MNGIDKQQEIEAQSFFTFISKVLKKISSAFKALINLFVIVFIYLFFLVKKRILILGTAFLIGSGVGIYHLYKNGPTFHSSFILKMSFDSGDILYKKISDINSLVLREDYKEISRLLNIDAKDAAHIYGIDLQPISNDLTEARIYKNYIAEVDTAIYKPIDRENYLERFPINLYPFQEVIIYSGGKINYDQVQKNLVNYLNENDYLKILHKSYKESFNKQINTHTRVMTLLDSMINSKIQQNTNSSQGNNEKYIVGNIENSSPLSEEWLFEKLSYNQIEITKLENFLYENEKIAMAITDCYNGVRESRLKFVLHWTFKYSLIALALVLLFEFYLYMSKISKERFGN